MKKYININDYQGGTWAMGIIEPLNYWKKLALQWSDSDGNIEIYNMIKKHKLDAELIKIINDIWSIELVEFNLKNKNRIIEEYLNNRYTYVIRDLIEALIEEDLKEELK